MLKKYGYDNVGKNPKFHEKSNSTKKNHAEAIKESYKVGIKNRELTCIKRYGYRNVLCSPSIRRHITETSLARYGVEFPQ